MIFYFYIRNFSFDVQQNWISVSLKMNGNKTGFVLRIIFILKYRCLLIKNKTKPVLVSFLLKVRDGLRPVLTNYKTETETGLLTIINSFIVLYVSILISKIIVITMSRLIHLGMK